MEKVLDYAFCFGLGFVWSSSETVSPKSSGYQADQHFQKKKQSGMDLKAIKAK